MSVKITNFEAGYAILNKERETFARQTRDSASQMERLKMENQRLKKNVVVKNIKLSQMQLDLEKVLRVTTFCVN